jgi:hypothetical protein
MTKEQVKSGFKAPNAWVSIIVAVLFPLIGYVSTIATMRTEIKQLTEEVKELKMKQSNENIGALKTEINYLNKRVDELIQSQNEANKLIIDFVTASNNNRRQH